MPQAKSRVGRKLIRGVAYQFNIVVYSPLKIDAGKLIPSNGDAVLEES